ncbi:MAG: hypothetical protein C5B44_03955 [Acidobacteria bacterium]|nr:MAG: hypothetical protein C5B44_03955 [Acidobacteriota bacterium]
MFFYDVGRQSINIVLVVDGRRNLAAAFFGRQRTPNSDSEPANRPSRRTKLSPVAGLTLAHKNVPHSLQRSCVGLDFVILILPEYWFSALMLWRYMHLVRVDGLVR